MNAPLILDIKGNALDDGPGIRSVVFFKGCLLDCSWCHNPESIPKHSELSFEGKNCLGLDACQSACEISCPQMAISKDNPLLIDRDICNQCMQCIDVCPSAALTQVGKERSVDDVCAELLKHKAFYSSSGGGVTLSGGEPTLYMDYISELLQKLKENGVHTLLQTCGLFPLNKFMEKVYPWLDTIYFDIKLMDETEHVEHCGANNKIIKDNFSHLNRLYLQGGAEILARTPLVPNITDSPENMTAIAVFLKDNKVNRTQLMSYNPLWHEKQTRLGQEFTADKGLKNWMAETKKQACEKPFIDMGIELI